MERINILLSVEGIIGVVGGALVGGIFAVTDLPVYDKFRIDFGIALPAIVIVGLIAWIIYVLTTPPIWISAIRDEITACLNELDRDKEYSREIPNVEWLKKPEQERRKILKDRYSRVEEFYNALATRDKTRLGVFDDKLLEGKLYYRNQDVRHKARLAVYALNE